MGATGRAVLDAHLHRTGTIDDASSSENALQDANYDVRCRRIVVIEEIILHADDDFAFVSRAASTTCVAEFHPSTCRTLLR